MKRSEMVDILSKNINSMLDRQTSEISNAAISNILRNLEEAGMKPPRLPEEICQAIMHIYYAGYSLYQWEEDILKDEKVVEELERRRAWAALSPEEKRAKRKAAIERLNRVRIGDKND